MRGGRYLKRAAMLNVTTASRLVASPMAGCTCAPITAGPDTLPAATGWLTGRPMGVVVGAAATCRQAAASFAWGPLHIPGLFPAHWSSQSLRGHRAMCGCGGAYASNNSGVRAAHVPTSDGRAAVPAATAAAGTQAAATTATGGTAAPSADSTRSVRSTASAAAGDAPAEADPPSAPSQGTAPAAETEAAPRRRRRTKAEMAADGSTKAPAAARKRRAQKADGKDAGTQGDPRLPARHSILLSDERVCASSPRASAARSPFPAPSPLSAPSPAAEHVTQQRYMQLAADRTMTGSMHALLGAF